MDPVRKFGLVGFPIKHSLSPQLFAKAFPEHFRPGAAEPWTYDLIEEEDFEKAWKRFLDEYDAVNVTAPFKTEAAARADTVSPEVELTGAANILVKTPDGISAFNSDYLAVLSILREVLDTDNSLKGNCAVIGTGGAGRAAKAASEALGMQTEVLHHDEISEGVEADIVIYTLPKAVPGIDRLKCRVLLEANYKDPCLSGTDAIYIPGTQWLRRQAEEGYQVMI